jgi:hypothetical protein
MILTPVHFLGKGMYTPSEAAMYARVTPQLMARWVHGSDAGSPVVRPEYSGDEDRTVSFLDLIQAMAIRAIRQEKGASLRAIRQAVEFAATQGVEYPFARKHTTYLFNGEIKIDVPGTGLMDASGPQRHQLNMKKILEVYLKDVGFGPEGLAINYTAFEEGGIKILMNPGYKFGEPVVMPGGHTAWTLWEACLSEGGIAEAASAFHVSEKEVEIAYKYVDIVRPATAS